VKPAPKPADEASRLAELRALALLDTGPEERFDRVTRLAQRLFDVPIALVSLVDEDRQWFKSHPNFETTETPREVAFCGWVILDDKVMQVPDATADPRFEGNPLVVEDPAVRFYAGVPISGPAGSRLGTLCLIDREPRQLSEADEASLRDLGEMIENEIATTILATGDPLTGLSNRRGFDLVGTKLIEVCERRGLPATLVFLDLDGLKRINDRHGHHVGDEAVRAFGQILVEAFRGSDVVARLGGDEFAVLMVGAPEAPPAIDRLGELLAARNQASDTGYDLAVSLGSASFQPGSGESLEGLLERADAAMYVEKRRRGGRSSVER
jgi:diguanylate cyclase (GGDEF)-like protein